MGSKRKWRFWVPAERHTGGAPELPEPEEFEAETWYFAREKARCHFGVSERDMQWEEVDKPVGAEPIPSFMQCVNGIWLPDSVVGCEERQDEGTDV